jgi:uncharacterized protein HemY
MYKLKEVLKEHNIKNSDVAKILNIKSLSTVSLKINHKAYFTTKEANALKNYINEIAGTEYKLEDLFSE